MRLLAFFSLLLFAASASASPPTVVDIYSGQGGTIVYLDAPYDSATDQLAKLLPVPYGEQWGIPAAYNNQPDGEGSDQPVTYHKATELTVLPSGYAVWFKGQPTQALSIERAGERSTWYYRLRPQIYGVWGRTTFAGAQIRLWGKAVGGRDAFDGRGKIWLVDEAGTMHLCKPGGTWREIQNDATVLVSLNVPGTLPPGKYLLRTHADVGQQWGWSNDEPIEIVERPVRPDVVKTVSPPADGAGAWDVLNAAKLAAGAGGTIELLPGTYRIDKRLELAPGQTLRGHGATLTGHTVFVRDDCKITGLHFTGGVHDKLIAFFANLGAKRVAIAECSFKWARLDIAAGTGWRVEECTFVRSGLNYGRETFIKGCKFSEVGWHHACTTSGTRDSCISECTIDGMDRGFVCFPGGGGVSGNFWYRNEIENITQIHNGCEHFLCEGGNTRQSGLATHVEGNTYQLDAPLRPGTLNAYACRYFDDQTTEAIPVVGVSSDEAGVQNRFTLKYPFRSQRTDVPVRLVYGFFDNAIYKTRMRAGMGAAVNIFGTPAHNNRFSNLVSFGPMYIKIFGLDADKPTTGMSFDNCELHGGRIHFSWTARYNVLDGVVVNDPVLSGTNQFSYVIALREGLAPVLESRGAGNAILRAAVMRPGGLVPAVGFDLVEQLEVVGD